MGDALSVGEGSAELGRLSEGVRIADRYVVRALLGRGGMGTVYQVFDEHLGEAVALKLLELREEQAEERFRQEVRIARRITHPNVARMHDLGMHDGRFFLTMELVEGTSLDRMLVMHGTLERELAVDIMRQVAMGLVAAHAAGVVHRDLKPGNVLLEMPRAVITDFGIARNLAGERVTVDTQLLGTPHYMAPEQVLGEQVDKAADVYALGIVLYECLTGTLPFDGESAFAVALARCRHAPVDPRDFVALPDALAELVLGCMRMVPAERPTAAGVVVRLKTMASHRKRNTLAFQTSDTQAPPPSEGPSWPIAPGSASLHSRSWYSKSSHGDGSSSGELLQRDVSGTGYIPRSGESLPGVSSGTPPFAPMKIGDQSLAVLPFSYRGHADFEYLGDSLSQELIDVLSRTRGLKVIGFGATQVYRDERDPRTVGAALNASAVVDGSVQASADRVRVAVRVLDSASGEQRWTERFDRQFEDIFELQEIMAQCIADALRVELRLAVYQSRLDGATMDGYLRARHRLRGSGSHKGYVEVVDALEKCIVAAPDFEPALASHAIACTRAWWSAFESAGDARDWRVLAEQSVERALLRAPEAAESHLAAAVVALQQGDLATTATELATTLRIAPTSPEAHRYLGELQCEAGRVKEGLKRLQLAVNLDPTQAIAYVGMVRVAALRGDDLLFDELLEKAATAGLAQSVVQLLRARQALWKRDQEALKTMYQRNADSPRVILRFMSKLVGFVIGEIAEEKLEEVIRSADQFGNSRLASLMGQYATEGYAIAGRPERALHHLDAISKGALVDVAWLEGCPALESLRELEGFRKNFERVSERAERIWRT